MWRPIALAVLIATIVASGYVGYRSFSAGNQSERSKPALSGVVVRDSAVASRLPPGASQDSITFSERATTSAAEAPSREVLAKFEARRETIARAEEQPGRIAGASSQRPEYFFPWPPPRSSSQMTFPQALSSKPFNFKTLGDVADHVNAALIGGGIEQTSYFSLPDDTAGYGMATRVEQIDSQTGKPLQGKARWEDRVQTATNLSFFETITLTERPKGRYRSFVFIVSTKPTPDNPDEKVIATLALARRWTGRGERFLSPEMRKIRLTPAHHLSVRVYEFEHEDKGQPHFIERSAWKASEHLAFDGIALDRRK